MSFPTDSPRVRLRLSRKEVRLILPGLRKVVAADRLWIEQRCLTRAAKDPEFWRHNSRIELYDPLALTPFREALTKLSNLGGTGGRVRFDVFQLAGCAFAARYTRTAVRHGHIQSWVQDRSAETKSLLRKLERLRRRGRRRFEARFSSDQYRAAARVWRNVLRWTRDEYLWCKCRRPGPGPSLRRLYCNVLSECCVLAAQGLQQHSVVPPSPPELRKLVRRALRSARRSINGPAVGALWRKPAVGRRFMAEFIIRTYGDKLQWNDLSSRQSRLAERLRSLRVGRSRFRENTRVLQ